MKLKTKITGSKVHEVGYRVFLLRKALELGVERFNAYNTKENGMKILIAFLEGDKDQIAAFQEFARENKPEDAEVSDRVFEDYEGYVISIADYMHLIQVEQLSKGIPAILSIDRKQDSLLGITKKGFDEMKTGFDEMKTGFREVTEEVRKGSAEVKNEIHLLRDDFRELFMREVNELRCEMQVLKETVARIEKAIAVG